MAKLGYTWYPKDWGNSESVFELTLSQRGLYRELIDLAMLNDNKTIVKRSTWSRKFGVSENELIDILTELSNLGLVKLDYNKLFIPSCEPRLKLVRGGSNGGKKSKPINKGNKKPISKPNIKPNSNQIEKKEKGKEKEIIKENVYRSFDHLSITKEQVEKLNVEYEIKVINRVLDNIENYKNNKNYKNLFLTARNWLTKEPKKKIVEQAEKRVRKTFSAVDASKINQTL